MTIPYKGTPFIDGNSKFRASYRNILMEWIDIRDKLPEKDTGKRILAYGVPKCESHEHIPCIEFCLYVDLYYKQIECELNGDCMIDSNHNYKLKPFFIFGEDDCILNATHWMSLPPPPIEL